MSKIANLDAFRGHDGERLRQLLRHLAIEIDCYRRSAPTMTPERAKRDLLAAPLGAKDGAINDMRAIMRFVHEYLPALNPDGRTGT